MKLSCVLTPSTVRHFPNAPLPTKRLASLDAALNERFSFQLALRADDDMKATVTAEGPEGWTVRVRRVGYVPLFHHNNPVLDNPLDTDGLGQLPGLVPDPLFDEDTAILTKDETNAFWFSVVPPRGAKPGKYRIAVKAQPRERWGEGKPVGRAVAASLSVTLHDVVLRPRRDFLVTHWFYNDCLITWYKTNLFDERFWEILPAYLTDIAEHGQDTVYVPLFTPPLDGDKHPSQLLKVKKAGKGRYSFDWSDVRRYVRLAKKCGLTHFEWCHLFAQWGCRFALRIYEGQGEGEKLLWPKETPATSETYRDFLAQLLPELEAFLREEKILKKSLFHISDEPHGDEAKANYKAAREMVRALAPWMRCIDALSQIEFGREKIVDMPVPTISTALDFHKEGIESWCYYCCGPRGEFLQHLMDTPLAKIAMHGFLFYRWPFKGFLHWGLNYWNVSQTRTLIDPYMTSDGQAWYRGWAYGDTFYVYPGEKGPVDSIRWEVFAESLQDYALLQTLGVDRDDKLLAPLKSFADFPKDAAWRRAAKARLYKLAEHAAK